MLKLLLINIAFAAMIFSCENGDTDDKYLKSEETYYDHADFEKNEYAFNLVSGDAILFLRESSYDKPEVIDEEYFQRFAFTVDGNTENSFDISGMDLKNLQFYYHISCFCPQIVDYRMKSGNIHGDKTGPTKWDVDIDIVLEIGYPVYGDQIVVDTTYSEYPYQFSGKFLLDSF